MELIKATIVKLKFSEFMTETEHFSNNTTILIVDEELRSRKIYLVLKFIYSKYKDLIFRETYFKEIEKYIEVFKYEAGIHAFSFSDDLYDLCIKLENRLRIISYEHFKGIEEYLNDNNAINVVVLDKESHRKNQYMCYIKEDSL